MKRILGLKIDVDTYEGMRKGVPRLLDIMEEAAVQGTFYLSIGPDASGRAIFQIIKNPLFLKKMIRTNAPALYGFKTALYGTLLPSPMIAMSFPDLVKKIIEKGHEVQFHAWDHRRWQDELPKRPLSWIKEWFENGIEGFSRLAGEPPSSFGAPAWTIDDRVMETITGYGFKYLSCTRAKEPFLHANSNLLEIPSDLPCFEETGIEQGHEVIGSLLKRGGIHVLPVHAEVEGGVWSEQFIKLLRMVKNMDYRIATLSQIREILPLDTLTARKYRMELLPGRSVPCAV